MGQEIFYCSGCQTQLRTSDFEKKAAFRTDVQVYCKTCAPAEVTNPAPPVATPKEGLPSSTTPSRGTRRGPGQDSSLSPGVIWGGVAAGVALLIGIGAVASGGRPATHAPRDPEPRVTTVAPAPSYVPPPVIDLPPRPPNPVPAPPPRVEAPAKTLAQDLEDLDREIKGYLREGQYPSALLSLDVAKRRRTEPSWIADIERRVREISQEQERVSAQARAEAEKKAVKVEPPKPVPAPAPAVAALPQPPLSTPPKPPVPVRLEPVAWWKLEEVDGTRAADAAGSAPGTLVGGAAWADLSPALRLDGKTGYVNLGSNLEVLRNTGACTLTAWVRPQAYLMGGTSNLVAAFSVNAGGKSTELSRLWMGLNEGNELRVGARPVDGDSGSATVVTVKGGIGKLKWHHVAGVVDFETNSIKIYVNGAEQATKGIVKFPRPATPDTPVGSASIGSEEGGKGKFFNGLVADVRLYERALPASEVAAMAAAPPPEPGAAKGDRVRTGLVALYTFMDAKGNMVRDVSGTGDPLNLVISESAATKWTSPQGLAILSSTLLVSDKPADKILKACRQSNEITIEAWIRPGSLTQTGPARIVTLSRDTGLRNFTLGQWLPEKSPPVYDVRMRTTATDTNGIPSISSVAGAVVPRLSHVVYTRSASGEVRIFVNGLPQGGGTVAGDFSKWDGSFKLALANEHTRDRTWLGEFRLVAIYSRALTAQEVAQNAKAPLQ